MADTNVIEELRGHVAAELERRREELVDAVSSALFSRVVPYQRLAGPGTVEALRTDIRGVLGILARTIAERRPLGPLDLDRFRRIGAERARQGLSLDAVSDGLAIGMATGWGFVRDALLNCRNPRVATALAADLAVETYPAMKQAADALAVGHGSEQGRGTYNRARTTAEFVGRIVDGMWSDERDAQRAAEALGVDLQGSWLLALVTQADGRSPIDFDGITTEIAEANPDALVGPPRMVPSGHVPILIPLTDVDEPLPGNLGMAAEVARAGNALLMLSDRVSTWAALPLVYRREADAIACARAAARSAGIVHTTDSQLYRLLRVLPMGARVEYVHKVLGPVLDLAPTKAAESLATLEAYFRGRGRLDETAADLQLHRNSFRYRLERAQALLGVNFRYGRDRMRVEVALALRRLDQEEALLLDDVSVPGSPLASVRR